MNRGLRFADIVRSAPVVVTAGREDSSLEKVPPIDERLRGKVYSVNRGFSKEDVRMVVRMRRLHGLIDSHLLTVKVRGDHIPRAVWILRHMAAQLETAYEKEQKRIAEERGE